MSQGARITLSRILAVNWYGYQQFIDVAGLTLITGANGSGKSALLDLIQFVMLGEQQSRFNKAAAGAGSGRTLRGYCLCDTNTTSRDGQERYLRPSSVTLAALEFTWPLQPGEDEPRRETWGARIEYEGPSSKPSTVWFRAGSRLEWSDFLEAEAGPQAMRFLPEDEFRTHLKRDLEGDAWDRQQTYLSEMALRSRLCFDQAQMAKTLPRAMAFEPESNFEKFVREFLLEPGLPDVRAVKASVDAHRRAQERLAKMHDQLERLNQIAKYHQAWHQARREAALFAHLAEALKHEEALENLTVRSAKLEERRTEHSSQQEAFNAALSERDDLERQVEFARDGLGDKGVLLARSKLRVQELQLRLAKLEVTANSARTLLRERVHRWEQWIWQASTLGLETPDAANNELTLMKGADEARGLEAAGRMLTIYHALRGQAEERLRPAKTAVDELESKALGFRRDLDNLREGQPAPAPLLNALKARGQRAVALGRVVEVRAEAEKWWPLLEALLGRHRMAILPEDFKAAWKVAQESPGHAEMLINPDELAVAKPSLKAGSLRQMVETKHAGAGQWLDALLGDVMPVKKAAQIEQHERALSMDGWFKDPPRRVKLVPEKELTLGEEGLRRMQDTRERDLKSIEHDLTRAKSERDDWQHFINRGREWDLESFKAPAGSEELRERSRFQDELNQLRADLLLLESPQLLSKVEGFRQLEATFEGVKERLIRLDERMAGFHQFEREQIEALATLRQQEEQTRIARQTTRAGLSGFSDAEIQDRIDAARNQTSSWRRASEMALALSVQNQNDAAKAYAERTQARRDLIAAPNHPDLAEKLDPESEDNDDFDNWRFELETHQIALYVKAAEDACKAWEDRLQHQVLDVLREKLEEAERTKRELNRAMNHEIGGWRYQVTSRADRAHTAIWTLVEKGLPTGTGMELFDTSAREEIERAKAELIAAIDAADNPEDKRHQRALDYRYYHHWDIEAKPAGRSDAAAISLNKSAKKQSGGENQAPFFVATLAAFRRVYDIGKRDDPQNLGLVVMDEAFSKLSGDRIDDCLALARNFGLQLIMAFPEDRLPTMFQHADTVVQCRVERGYDEKNEQVTRIENWVVRVEGARLLELLE
jgi:energy-coupling factor transporter ATP-binding protein EcfA2